MNPESNALTDDELYNRYLAGDNEAGDNLLLRYENVLIAYVNSLLGNYWDAEDILIDCFTVLLEDKPRIREGNFKAYLFRVAHNKACHVIKKRARISTVPFTEDGSDDTTMSGACSETASGIREIAKDLSPEKDLLNRERDDILLNCLERLFTEYKEALWLVYALNLSYDEAAKIMGCNKKRINNLITRGKAALKAELEKEGIGFEDI